jgi:hypothetical protein
MSDVNIVDKYHEAWTHRDMDTARSGLADNLDFQGPIDAFSTADDFITTLTGFAQMLNRVDLLKRLDTDAAACCMTASRSHLPGPSGRRSSLACATARSPSPTDC